MRSIAVQTSHHVPWSVFVCWAHIDFHMVYHGKMQYDSILELYFYHRITMWYTMAKIQLQNTRAFLPQYTWYFSRRVWLQLYCNNSF